MLNSSTRHLVVPRNPFSDAKLWADWKNTTVWVSKIANKYLQWIGLRENLQETMVFTIKYEGFHGGSWKFSHHPTLWHQSRFSYRRAQSSVVPLLNSTLSVPTACETAWPICSCLLDITYWLVVSATLKNISQIGSSSQLLGKIKNVPNHQSASSPLHDFPIKMVIFNSYVKLVLNLF